MVKTAGEASVFAAGLVFGTASSILSKQLFTLTVAYDDGEDKLFEKPLFQTALMFVGMALALPLHFFMESRKKDVSEDYLALDEDQAGERFVLTFRTFMFLFIPAMFDLVATALAYIGLVLIEVSIFQLMKCTVIVFVAVLKSTVLKHRVYSYQWFGVLLNMVAVTCAASSAFFQNNDDDDKPDGGGSTGFGLLMVVLSCLVQSAQYVFEEYVMGDGAGSMPIPPLIVVGIEGVWGLILSVVLVLPLASVIPGKDCSLSEGPDCVGVYENTADSFDMMGKSSIITWLIVIYVFVITGYNVSAIYVTALLSALWHSILDSFRPMAVFITSLGLYLMTNGSIGEEWVVSSWLQVAGLVMLVFGTMVYNANIKLYSWFDYSDTSSFMMQASPFSSPFIRSNSMDARRRVNETAENRARVNSLN